MRVHSLIYDNYAHRRIEVEVSLHPGLPSIQILGLPDAVVKDCVWRIRAAFLKSGFSWPQTSKVIVNLKPCEIRKRGPGLDLAIAAALLWATGQVSKALPTDSVPLLYGELDLTGEVHVPSDFVYFQKQLGDVILTGQSDYLPFEVFAISHLSKLVLPERTRANKYCEKIERPPLPDFNVPQPMAELLQTVALGEHSCFIAGKAGAGKSTFALVIPSLIEKPSTELIQEYSRYHVHSPTNWRPTRRPHHTGSAVAVIGGGAAVQPGELTRAHGGVLIMDEFLEFDKSVQEALREPLEQGSIELIRSTQAKTLPAKFLLLATSNLCSCGDFEPGWECRCVCGIMKRRRYLEKLSGPMLDRFAMVIFTRQWENEKRVALRDLYPRVEAGIEFRKNRNQDYPNSEATARDLMTQLAPHAEKYFLDEEWSSQRRSLSLLRVARTYADLELSEFISLHHLEAARIFSILNPSSLKRIHQDRLALFA